MNKKLSAICFLLLLFTIPSTSFTQIITIGTGTNTNTGTTYPAPYGNWYDGAKHQFLIRASELTSAGMSAGDINSLAFDVATASGNPLTDFTISLKLVSINDLTGNFETGLTTVWGPQTYTEVGGWNTHTFGAPFYWDGTSNLLVETCFNSPNFSNNAQTRWTATPFASANYFFQDNNPVLCNQNNATISFDRPNMRFDWTSSNVPPVGNFTANTTFTCDGTISFTDLSTNNPTSWQWDFGDGNTDTVQNPTHTYTADGTYTVTLIVTNPFGSDTIVFTNFIVVNTSAPTPVTANCEPQTTSYCCGFGITNVTFNTINHNSNDGAEGYSDFTCVQTTVTEGQVYPISITADNPTTHNFAVWIDFNNDGVLDDNTERVFTASSQLVATGNIIIPGNATLNTPLRMRVSADYDFSNPPMPCVDLEFGQAEDYAITIIANTQPPVADFSVSDTLTCDGVIEFTDLSTNLPFQWIWDFGDGNSSNQQHPTHTYTADGTYTVTLIAINAHGNDTIVYSNLIVVNLSGALTPAACTPNTLAYCCDYGIYQVTYSGIDHSTGDGSEGYQDFSCLISTNVMEGIPYNIDIRTGPTNPQDTKVWIDLNNDGVLDDNTELMFTALNQFNPSGSFTIPSGAVLGTPVRMRISSDVVGSNLTSCTTPTFGQVEDYAITIDSLQLPPIANFTADVTYTCDGVVNFTDLSTNLPTGWLWDFGDGNTDTAQNPTHTYTSSGTYTVSLTASNTYGSDQEVKLFYITVDFNGICDTINLPPNGAGPIQTSCGGLMYDNGGPNNNYGLNSNSWVTIAPTGALNVTLTFTFFDFVSGQPGDTLFIYDGPTTSDPILAKYWGNGTPPVTMSTGGSITVHLVTTAGYTDPGFALEWSCTPGTTPEASFSAANNNICENECITFTDLSTGNGITDWNWSFPGGTPSSYNGQTPPAICYTSAGTYDVTLSVTNPLGTDDTTITGYITVMSGCFPEASFTADNTSICENDCVTFTDQSTGVNISNWTWLFPGGIPSSYSGQTPGAVCYTSPGTYNVTLTITDANGTDDTLATSLITVISANDCDTAMIPVTGTATKTECDGTVTDDGGSMNDYSNNSDGSLTIAPTGANNVTVDFISFDFETGADFLYVYDGPDILSPLIGQYDGTALPNGGSITSSGGSITLRQVTGSTNTHPGFVANWNCLVSVAENELNDQLDIYPNPARDQVTIDFNPEKAMDKVGLRITNMVGQTVHQESVNNVNSFKRIVDVSTFPKGVYMITIQTNNHQITKRITIQ